MSRSLVCGAFFVGMVMAAALAFAEDVGTEIELTSLDEVVSGASPQWDEVSVQDVASRMGTSSQRVYGSLMIGNAFAGMKSGFGSGFNSSDTLFGAGGALGVAFDRPNGQLRLEVEGMGRDTYDGAVIETPMLQHVVTNNWSAMVNAWRDLMLTDRVGIYGGGGIGAGGYQLGFRSDVGTTFIEPESGFAWQAGGGVIWEATDRMTFDVGYRFFLIDRLPFEPAISGFGHQFHASELMFTLRIYEPFRGWRS